MKKSFLQTFIVLGLFAIFTFALYPSQLGAATLPPNESQATRGGGGEVLKSQEEANKEFERRKEEERLNASNPGFWNCTFNPISCLLGTGSAFSIQLISLGVRLSGGIFDTIVKYTIEDQSLITGMGVSILPAWKIVRDLANIIIVFSLLYLGIKTILNGNGFAETKVLISIIIAAVLINFSLVFTQTVFNVSNVIGSQIGQQITFSGQSSAQTGTKSISEGLVQMIRPDMILTSLLDFKKDGWDQLWTKVQGALFTGTAMLLLIVVFLGASFLLIYRFMIFVVLMVTSPIGVTSKFIPWFEKMGESWWKALKTQAIVLPVFLLTLYISILFVAPLSSQLTGSALTSVSPGQVKGTVSESVAAELITFIFNYLLIIGFLLLPLIVPGKIGAAGSSFMTGAADWTTKKIRSLPERAKSASIRTAQFGAGVGASAAAKTGRLALGKGLGSTLNSKNLKEKAQQKGVGGFFARQAVKAGAGLQNKTYDVRNINAVSKSNFGKGMGKGIEGWSKALDTKKKSLENKKKEEMKMFGFDKIKVDEVKLNRAETKRDTLESETDSAKTAYLANTANAALKAEYEAKKKDLEDAELEVGKLKNVGESKYQENIADPRKNLSWMEKIPVLQAHHDRIVAVLNKTTIRNHAYSEAKEEVYKKFKDAGQSKGKKKKKAEDKWIEDAASGKTGAPPPPGEKPETTGPTVTTTVGTSGGTTTT